MLDTLAKKKNQSLLESLEVWVVFAAESSGGGGESVSGGNRFTVPDAPGYTYHVFNDIHSGANFVNDSTMNCDILLVGGGGAGGSDVGAGAAGGGGGGAVVYYPGVSLTAGTYAVHVGEGGHNNYCAYDDNGELDQIVFLQEHNQVHGHLPSHL